MELGCIILAGGKSRRMGKDKGQLLWNGHTMIDEIVSLTTSYPFTQRLIVANDGQAYAHIAATVVFDIHVDYGALAGIHAGLCHSSCAYNWTIPCDMPMVSMDILHQLLVEWEQTADVIVPKVDGYLQPLLAIYHKNCIGAIESMIQQKEKKVAMLFERVSTKIVEMEIHHNFLLNINTLEQYEQGLDLLLNQGRVNGKKEPKS